MESFDSYFSCVPRLETARFILRPFTRDDMDSYFDILRDEAVQQYLGSAVPVFDREPHITNWLNNVNGRLLQRKLVFTWCVEEAATGSVVGRIDLGGFIKKTAAEISYHFARAYWGKGVATEVVSGITDFGLNQLNLRRIQALVIADHIASIRVLEKNGYRREGHMRFYPYGREFRDVVMLAKIQNMV